MKKSILILGKTPPPIGGVTIHVKRLLENLEKINYPYKFINLSIKNLFIIFSQIINFKLIHLHSSNSILKVIIVGFCKVLNKKLIITNHGDLNRYGNYKDKLDRISIKNSYIPIVLNEKSYLIARKLNKETQQISSFIPPIECEELNKETQELINNLRNKYSKICCTNASGYHLNKNGKDIYGIKDLINQFKFNQHYCLIISDPTSDYYKLFSKSSYTNIYFITGNHSYFEILKYSDVSIRNTLTDGDSLSVKESIYLNKLTLASDIVSRPAGTITYNEFTIDLINSSIPSANNEKLNGFTDILKLYES